MIEIDDIKDRESLQQWLTDWPRENGMTETQARAIARVIDHRAIMRDLPKWWGWMHESPARKRDPITLLMLRMFLISGAMPFVPNPEILSAESLAFAALKAGPSDARIALARPPTDVEWNAVKMDCTVVSFHREVWELPLWLGQENPLLANWMKLKKSIDDPQWSFWIKWYDDALAGTPPNWDMLEQIALIEPEVWEEGAEAVSERIALITEKYELLSEVQATRVSLGELRAEANALAQRSHNNPPELVDTDMSVIRSVEIIWAELGQAEEELEKPDPSPSRLRRISAALLEASKKVAMYCAELGDTALKNAAKEVGSTGAKWTIGVLAASYAAQNPGIQSLAARIFEFAGKLTNLP